MSLPAVMNTDQLLGVLVSSKHPTAIYTTNHLVVQIANKAMLRLWNSSEECVGKPLTAAVPQLLGQPLLDILSDVWQAGTSREVKRLPFRVAGAKEDEWRYFDTDFQVIPDEEGRPQCILQTAVEVTGSTVFSEHKHQEIEAGFTETEAAAGRRSDTNKSSPDVGSVFDSGAFQEEYAQVKEALENERDRVRRFFMQAPAGICVLDGPDFVFEVVNPQYQQFFPHRELMGKPLAEALPELAGTQVEDILREVYSTGKLYEGKELHVLLAYEPGGPLEDRYFNFIYQARFNSRHEIDGILVFVIEVTDTVNNRRRIEENERSLRSMVMSSHYGLMILRGRDYVIEIVNQQIANLWQKELPDITGKKLMEVLPEIEDQPFPALLANVYNTGIPYGQEEEVLYLQTPHGPAEKFVSFYYDPMFDADGEVSGIIVACEDITEQVRSRRLLHQSYEEQQTFNEEISAANEELANINEEMAATNEELISTNDELVETQISLQQMINQFEESENKIRAIVNSAPFPIGVYEGREMRIVLANKAIMDVWGKGYDVLGKRYAELLPELERTEIFGQLDKVFSTGEAYHARNQQVDIVIDGTLKSFYFNYSFTPLLDQNGNVYGVMNTASDVTDLILAKHKIEKNEQNLNNLILQSPVAMCYLSGPEHVVTVANPLMVEIWGKPMEEVMYRPIFDALPDAREQGLEEVMANVYNKGEAFRASEMAVNLIRNGQPDTVYQNFVYEPFYDSDGVVVGIIAITINVTEQVLARKKIEQNEAELLQIKKQLEAELEVGKEIQRQKDSFIGIASHELKTPLTSLNAIVQVANKKLKTSDDPFLSGAMEKAQLQIKRMSSLISGFLNISRFESGNILVERQQFDMQQLIEEIVEEVGIMYSTHTVNFSGCESVTVNADRDKINSVISNLVTNAIKYSPAGKEVLLKCEIDQQEVKVCVEDHGIGIRQEDQQKVFDRYFRVEADHTQNISGFGIGLYLSAEIVRRHGGRIWVESELGKGSRFYFTLPFSQPAFS